MLKRCVPLSITPFYAKLIQSDGAVVQLGERLTGSQKVGGSNPPSSTLRVKYAVAG